MQSIKIDIEKLNFVPAYTHGKAGLKGIKWRGKYPGLYFIKENGILVYIGMTKFNLMVVLYRHFQKWGLDKKQPRHYRVCYNGLLSTNKYEVAAMYIHGDTNVEMLEIANIKHYNPRDNRNKYPEYDQAFLDTGFTDSNGKEIRVGDYLMLITKNSQSSMLVKFENGIYVGEGPFNTHPLMTYLESDDFVTWEIYNESDEYTKQNENCDLPF